MAGRLGIMHALSPQLAFGSTLDILFHARFCFAHLRVEFLSHAQAHLTFFGP